MPRHHTVWDSNLGHQVDIEFTAAEETARDAEELANKQELEETQRTESRRITLRARIGADSATLRDVLAYLRAGDN